MDIIHKHPRLYTDQDLKPETTIDLPEAQTHYLKNVLRFPPDTPIRLFNTRNGEWLAHIQTYTKKSTTLKLNKQTITQPKPSTLRHLYFSPIKKNRLDFLIEKAVELGATDLTPILTNRTINRKINAARIHAQIIEAAEQCERLTLPTLHNPSPLKTAISNAPKDIPILWATERDPDAPHLCTIQSPQTFLIGPEGGFDDQENNFLLKQSHIHPITLGAQILRAETAALFCLSIAHTQE